MTVLKRKLRQKSGSAAVEFIMTAAMLILIFATIVSAMVYITQCYNASYICRRAVRTIEVTGQYNSQDIRNLANDLGGDNMDDLRITVDARYKSGTKIQLRDEFTVRLEAKYPINILMLGQTAVRIRLPIRMHLSGRSEVYWK